MTGHVLNAEKEKISLLKPSEGKGEICYVLL